MTIIALYTGLSDDDLATKIAMLTTAYEEAMSGAVAVVAGEGRRIEYTKSNSAGLAGLLTAALNEQAKRNGVQTSGAIEVYTPWA